MGYCVQLRLRQAVLVCVAWTVAFLAAPPGALAWTSIDAPFFRPVHQMAIDNVLGSTVAAANLTLLKDQQTVVDKDQRPDQSEEHSMTGLEKDQSYAVEKPIYIQNTESLLRDDLTNAVQQRNLGNLADAFELVGKAIHALQDATSPAHEGFKPWSYNETLFSKLAHVTQENQYPAGPYQSRLEGSVRWAYDMFMERITLPASFFDAETGVLQIPAPYLSSTP